FTVRPDSSGARKLTHEAGENHREASYSANGRRIVYERGRARFASLAIATAEGTNVRVLANHDGSNPIFSPNGRRIVFDNQVQIFSIRSDGSGLRPLTPGGPGNV